MPLWTPDPTFYPSPKMAMEAPPERLAFVAMLNIGTDHQKDALGVVDTDPGSSTYGQTVGKVDMVAHGWSRNHMSKEIGSVAFNLGDDEEDEEEEEPKRENEEEEDEEEEEEEPQRNHKARRTNCRHPKPARSGISFA